jgi:uncharacterized protein YbjT (DUF2867 family)
MAGDKLESTFLVTGGTGTIGVHVVRGMSDIGLRVRALSRKPRLLPPGVEWVQFDLLSAPPGDDVLANVSTIVHCAGGAKGDEHATANLIEAARRVGVEHFVHVSVVGANRLPVRSAIDRAMFGYFAEKANVERLIEESGVGWSGLRACQCHELIAKIVEIAARFPIIPYPSGFWFQPIAASEVAGWLMLFALGGPTGTWCEVGGPEILPARVILEAYLDAIRKKRLLIPMPSFGAAARTLRAGANLAPKAMVGTQPWSNFVSRLPGEEQ